MKTKKKIVVTGAFGYSGKTITANLLSAGYHVKTLTNSTNKPNPFGNKIEVAPLSFNDSKRLTASLTGYDVLINTYWVRFNHKKFNHKSAVDNTKVLFDCAKNAGIQRIIHVSITNPSIESDLEYFKGKGILENYLQNLGVNYSIIRPAVLFGKQDILINNIAWMARHLPVFGVFGKGDYKLQPIHVDDFANIIINEISKTENAIINAIGPETFSYKELVKSIMSTLKIKKKVFNAPPYIGYLAGRLISFLKKDVTITRAEIKGLMDNLLYVKTAPTGKIKLTDWVKENQTTLGVNYNSELQRRN